MKIIKQLTLIFSLTFLSLAAFSGRAVETEAKSGDIYYTQFSLFHQKGVHETTNYRLTDLVPINTPVTFVRWHTTTGGQGNTQVSPLMNPEIILQLPSGQEMRIKCVKRYTGENIDGIFARTLAKQKVDLTPFTPLETTHILSGTVAVGMSKAAVLRAMGYPPKHRTKSLTLNTWYYWSDEDHRFPVKFRDDKVISVD